ncbi:hypothetical protein B7P43_G05812 [Cryptotermes secundus]|uniref:DUF4817 domain-containing protein n=1 Tax=Cryptotermes secundus TaxID=105785 RepID=A0A2J7PUQ1_9NEOP|nr:hypothetical protein B7P43_G05812 [Cryptotermes secundus]
MSTPQEQVQCVLWPAESLTVVQRRFRTQYGRQRSTRKNVRFWNKLRTAGSLLRVQSAGKTRTSEENINRIREIFQRSPRKSIRAASLARTNFAVTTLERIDTSPSFLRQECFSDEMTFHVNGNPKVNVWADLMHDKLTGLFFFSENTVTLRSYLDMLKLYARPQLPAQIILQEDGASPNFCHHIGNHLDREMARRWIGRDGPIVWPPRSPDLSPLDFFLGYVKNVIYQVKIKYPQHLKACIRDAVATVTPNTLQVPWNEVEYRRDSCRATKGAHVEFF